MESKVKAQNFKDKLAMFQDRAKNGRQNNINKPEKIKYHGDKNKMNQKYEEDLKVHNEKPKLNRENTISFFPKQFNTNNFQRMTNKIADIKKARENEKERIKKEIHEKK